MTQITQTRRLSYADLDYDRLSGQYFGWGALLAVLRIVWIIALTTGVFGTPPDSTLETIGDLLADALWVYTGLGLVAVIGVLIMRSRSEEIVPSTRLLINYAGMVILLLTAYRVGSVVEAEPEKYPITLWGLQLVNGLVLGGMYALVALGYTLVYGILFMINFAHGEVLVMGTFGGWFALTYVLELGGGTFEVGAASVAGFLLPLFLAILFLPLETLAARAGRRNRGSRRGRSDLAADLVQPADPVSGGGAGGLWSAASPGWFCAAHLRVGHHDCGAAVYRRGGHDRLDADGGYGGAHRLPPAA